MSGRLGSELRLEGGNKLGKQTLIASMGYITVCSCRARVRLVLDRESNGEVGVAYGYAGEGACCHVLHQGEVGRKGFIAGADLVSGRGLGKELDKAVAGRSSSRGKARGAHS